MELVISPVEKYTDVQIHPRPELEAPAFRRGYGRVWIFGAEPQKLCFFPSLGYRSLRRQSSVRRLHKWRQQVVLWEPAAAVRQSLGSGPQGFIAFAGLLQGLLPQHSQPHPPSSPAFTEPGCPCSDPSLEGSSPRAGYTSRALRTVCLRIRICCRSFWTSLIYSVETGA